MTDLNDELILEIFYDSWKIPIGVFEGSEGLVKLYSAGGERQTQLYMEDCRQILSKEGGSTVPILCYDLKGSCWCIIPMDKKTILFGPVQTGRNPDYPYKDVPEHTWSGFRDIARSLISLLLGRQAPLVEKEDTYVQTITAKHMYQSENDDYGFSSFDEMFDCVRLGDAEQLNQYLQSGEFYDYLDRVMNSRAEAETVFLFNLAKTYHTASDAGIALQDLTPLVGMYLAEMPKYRSMAAFKAGMGRMLYDFTRHVRQMRESSFSALTEKARLYIHENLYRQISIGEIASHCGVSSSTLQHRFKEETGISVTEAIRNVKAEKACFFLKHTGLSCSDIAFRMGYCSQSFFIRQFRASVGVTPSEYRKHQTAH
ncbi:MAG: helix-turn-helix transcriptional regulator [Lachnospiraceae bacterium]|nr:helix-turn-helix transcriptional regulator [Lachnospiraceae bacterium]